MESDRNGTENSSVVALAGVGDRELWYAEGGPCDDKGRPEWMFPIFVDWKDGANGIKYAALFPALCPPYALLIKLKALFEVHDKISRDKQWLIRAEMVQALLKKAPGITIERYYKWGDSKEQPIRYTEAVMPGHPEPKRFKCQHGDTVLVSSIAEESGLQSSVVKIVLAALEKVAADILIEQHKPIDLGFVKLIAVPFRANWKEIVCFKLRKLGLLKHLKEEVGQAQDGDGAGLPETLCSPHNVALRREWQRQRGFKMVSRVDYCIETITSKDFEHQVTRIETKRRSIGHTAYVGFYEKTVERLYENLLEILRAYRRKIGYPFARIHQSSITGGLRFVETVGIKARAYGRNLRDIPVHIVPPARGFSARAEESEPALVHQTAIEVPKLPAFSEAKTPEGLPLDDVWEREERGAVEALGNGQGGNGGLPLLDAGESAPSGQSVLSRATSGRESSWVEIIGD